MTDFVELIPELPSWNNGQGISVDGWIGCSGNFQLAIGYSTLFWPTFIEHDGMVFRKEADTNFDHASVAGWLAQFEGDRTATEQIANHLHLIDIHYVGCPDASRERVVYLGRILQQIYRCKLAGEFPDRRFVVEFDDTFQDDLHDYQLTFFQLR